MSRLVGAHNIVEALPVCGGFSAAAAWQLVFDNGARGFAKGAHPFDPSHGAANLRGEVAAAQNNSFIRVAAPTLLGMASLDAGDDNGWWLGLWQDVGVATGDSDAAQALGWLEKLAQADAEGVPDYHENPYLAGFFNDKRKWRQLDIQASARQRFESVFSDGALWLERHLARLIDVVDDFSQVRLQTGLMHGDLRVDNIHVTTERVWLIDWANAARGPLVFDAVFLAASLVMRNLISAERAIEILKVHDEAAGMTAAMAGYFAYQTGRLPVAPMPRLRLMQTGMLVALLQMLAVFGIIDSLPAQVHDAGGITPTT